MRIFHPLVAMLGLMLLSGCAFSTGFREGRASDLPPETTVIVALTETKLLSQLDAHTIFWSRSRDVVRSLADRPGLVGYSIRLEPLGTRVWTMTVWRDEASLMAFVQSATHARAVRDGLPTLADGRFAQVRVTRAETPLAWPDAVERLARDGRRYYE